MEAPRTVMTAGLTGTGRNLRYALSRKYRAVYLHCKDMTHWKFDNFAFENVENFNYLGSILNADNKINMEIAERIAKGNKAYYDNAKLIKPKFLKENTKMKMSKTMIRPVVT